MPSWDERMVAPQTALAVYLTHIPRPFIHKTKRPLELPAEGALLCRGRGGFCLLRAPSTLGLGYTPLAGPCTQHPAGPHRRPRAAVHGNIQWVQRAYGSFVRGRRWEGGREEGVSSARAKRAETQREGGQALARGWRGRWGTSCLRQMAPDRWDPGAPRSLGFIPRVLGTAVGTFRAEDQPDGHYTGAGVAAVPQEAGVRTAWRPGVWLR